MNIYKTDTGNRHEFTFSAERNHSLLLLCEFDQLEQLNTNLQVEQNVSLTNYSMNIFSMKDSRELSEEYTRILEHSMMYERGSEMWLRFCFYFFIF